MIHVLQTANKGHLSIKKDIISSSSQCYECCHVVPAQCSEAGQILHMLLMVILIWARPHNFIVTSITQFNRCKYQIIQYEVWCMQNITVVSSSLTWMDRILQCHFQSQTETDIQSQYCDDTFYVAVWCTYENQFITIVMIQLPLTSLWMGSERFSYFAGSWSGGRFQECYYCKFTVTVVNLNGGC